MDCWYASSGMMESRSGFPRPKMHEGPKNCVVLSRDGLKLEPSRYAQFGVGAVGWALRPDVHGELRFRVAKGGTFRLHTNFDPYKIVRFRLRSEPTIRPRSTFN